MAVSDLKIENHRLKNPDPESDGFVVDWADIAGKPAALTASEDGKFSLDQVAMSNQLTATIANGQSGTIAGPTDLEDGQFVVVTWQLIVNFNDEDHLCGYLATVKRVGGVITVMHERATLDAPVGIVITAVSLSDEEAEVPYTEQPGIHVANATGHAVTHYTHWTAGRQVK